MKLDGRVFQRCVSVTNADCELEHGQTEMSRASWARPCSVITLRLAPSRAGAATCYNAQVKDKLGLTISLKEVKPRRMHIRILALILRTYISSAAPSSSIVFIHPFDILLSTLCPALDTLVENNTLDSLTVSMVINMVLEPAGSSGTASPR